MGEDQKFPLGQLHIQKEVPSRQLLLVFRFYGFRRTRTSSSTKPKEKHSVAVDSKENVGFLIVLFLWEREATMPKGLGTT